MAARLTPAERDFFRGVGAFVFSNPFSRDRMRLLSRLLPGATIEDLRRDRRALADVIAEKLARFDAGRPARLEDFSPDDRPHLETAFLYVAYHHYIDDLDRLIERQAAADAVLHVPFGAEILKTLGRRGLPDEDAVRHLGFF